MNIKLQQGNIVEFESDVLVYSTNLKLLMGGGVGAALMDKYGYDAQKCLYDSFDNSGSEKTKLGNIFDCKTEAMPWKKVLHTIATDEDYVTDTKTVENILRESLSICELTHGVSRLSMSALGCGYGNLKHEQFIEVLKNVSTEFKGTDLKEIIVVCDNSNDLERMKNA